MPGIFVIRVGPGSLATRRTTNRETIAAARRRIVTERTGARVAASGET
jgi:hypothetical protein